MTIDYVALGSLIIDDLVFADGTTSMNTLGGAGTHALIGMRVWSDRLGYVSTIGSDLDPLHRTELEEMGVDLRGFVVHPESPTPRAWQILENHHLRIEIFRTDPDDLNLNEPPLQSLPEDYFSARGMLLHRGTLTNMGDLISAIRSRQPDVRLGWEPAPHHIEAPEREIKALLPLVDFFSPCLDEARAITGESRPDDMVKRLNEWGARVVALRMGADGSLVVAGDGERYQVPAVPADIVDTTGAGNAYCGGFLVGLSTTGDVREAAAHAAVSASIAIEQVGIPRFDEKTRERAERRLEWARERMMADPATPI